jgi:hypothetical protein
MQPHDHEWQVPQDDSAVFYEDGAVFVRQYCQYVEILDSYTDDGRDEVYYEEGQSCDQSRTFRFDLTGVERLHGLRDQHEDFAETLAETREAVHTLYDRDPRLVEEIEQHAAERLCGPAGDDEMPAALDWVVWDDVDKGPHTIGIKVHHGHARTFAYRLTFEFTEER